MEVKTFDISQLEEAKAALKEAFLREEYDENYNEWEFAQRVLQSPGYRAKAAGYPWVAVLGSSYYARFGFEPCAPYGITVSEDAFANEHLQILFFQEEAKAQAAGRITYCDAFYDGDGNLL